MPPASPPVPHGPTPSPRQLAWHRLEFYGFLHFTVDTFTDKEWGYGDESPSVFAPTDFSAEQIVASAASGGMTGLILTCKHHDGFCLWPSHFTEHSVRNSPWRSGRGDIVREISDACRAQGLKFGVYLSPWDRNHRDYGRPAYLTYYRNQLRELLSDYGPVFEVWFDGANGGDGYYGGAREHRSIDPRTYYDWETTWSLVRSLQPDACMFGGPDVRWCGNEAGFAGETCWATINRRDLTPDGSDTALLNVGQRNGADWLPPEVDVSIRPGWFYHAKENAAVKTVDDLLPIYLSSVGRGANLLLNIPPDPRGRIPDADAAVLRQWRRLLDDTFAANLARGAAASASNTRGNCPRFSPANVLDGNLDTYWCTDDAVTTPELILDLPRPVTFNLIRLREHLPLGQRVDCFAFDAWSDDRWTEIASATSIGPQRLLHTSNVTTDRLRLRILQAAACPALSELSLFNLPSA